MRNFLCLFIFMLNMCCIAFAQEYSVIEPELELLLERGGEEKVAVTIVLKPHSDASVLKAKAAACRNRSMARNTVVNELKSNPGGLQLSLMDFLRAEEKRGNVAGITYLWIANTVCCDAVADVVYQLALRDDVLMIGCNKEVQMLCCSKEEFIEAAANVRASNAPHLIQVRASAVWEQGYTGKNVVVAILDSGINDEHRDLKDHLWEGYADTDGDGVADDLIHGWNYATKDEDGNSNIKDDYGHGTHCAGIICGDGTSGNVTGAAPDATLMTVKTIDRSGGGSPAKMIRGVQFAIENGADIISISSGFKSAQISASDKEALRRTFENALSAGVIAFVAAGNDGAADGEAKYVDFPAACPPPYLHPDQEANSGGLSSVVCVGAVNRNNEYASFSSQGPVTWQDTEYGDYLYDGEDAAHFGLIRPDICAPGELVYSLNHTENDKYKLNSGTSQATPCAAGIAALMLEKNGTLTPADVCRIMETTATKLSDKKNNLTGSGAIDALNAVNGVEAAGGKPFVKVVSFSPETLLHGNGRELSVSVTNFGHRDCSSDAVVSLLVDDEYVSIENNSASLSNLGVNETKNIAFSIDVKDNAPNNHTVYVKAKVTDGDLSWTDDIVLEINSYARISCSLASSNVIDAGEDVVLVVDVLNDGTVATTAATDLSIECSSPYVTIENNTATVGVIAPGESRQVEYRVNVSRTIPDNSDISFDIYAVPNNYTDTKNLIYEFEVGTDNYGALDDGFNGWTAFDASNSERNHVPWWHSTLSEKHGMEVLGTNYSGKGHVVSESTCHASNREYTVPIDNYLVSPKIKVTASSKFKFKARIHSLDYYGEHFGVAVSETGNSDAASFVTIKEWVINKQDGADWLEFGVDLSEYEGKEIYVAVRHFFTQQEWDDSFNGYYFYALNVDDAEFTGVIDMSTAFKYDNYSYFYVKVSSDPLPAPENLVATLVGGNSVSLSWNPVINAQSYNVYRNGEWIKNVSGTACEDTALKLNTSYSYTVAAVYNGKEYEMSTAAVAITEKEDYMVSIKSVVPEFLVTGENRLSLTMINDGKYNQDARSTVTLSTESPYVTVSSGSVGINSLTVGAEVTKEFVVVVDEAIPDGTEVEFNLNIAQVYSPFRVYEHAFTITYGENIPEERMYELYISSAGYSTLYLDYDAVIPYGIEAYYADRIVGDCLKLEEIDGVIPAWTAVVIKGNEGNYVFPESEETAVAVEGNLLSGTLEDTYIDAANGKYYVLSMVDGIVGMYVAKLNKDKYGGVGTTHFLNNANRVYLALLPGSDMPDTGDGGQSSNGFRFFFPGITVIEKVKVDNGETRTVYDILGRPVDNPSKGIYIKNGRKVLIK